MEINGTNHPLIVSKTNVQRIQAPGQSGQAQKSGEGQNPDSDRLELSVRSREISHLDELIRSAPDVRELKVEQIRRDLQAGTYNVKAEKIAAKMIGGHFLNEVT
jgi:negative regulator of flagellin synthesis FlgM